MDVTGRIVRFGSLILAVLLLSACGGGGGGGGDDGGEQPAPDPSTTMEAPDLPDNITSHNDIEHQSFTVLLNNSGGEIDSCSSNPELPAGVSVNATSAGCEITGQVSTAMNASSYDITASNSSGSDTAQFTLTVNFSVTTPSLADTSVSVVLGESFTEELPNSAGPVASCSSTPRLPDDLNIKVQNNSCVISGSVSEAQSPQKYTITAINRAGTNRSEFTLEVVEQLAVPRLTVESDWSFELNQMVNIIIINNNGGRLSACRIESGVLMAGMTLSKSDESCVIQGQAEAAGSASLIISGSNEAGADNVTLNLTVIDNSIVAPSLGGLTSLTMTVNDSINLTLTNDGHEALQCASQPPLPSGLLVVPVSGSCAIQGEALIESNQKKYSLSASNTGGQNSLEITISVTASSLNAWGDGPDPDDFDHVARIEENWFNEASPPKIQEEGTDQPLLLSALESPVGLIEVVLDNGTVVSDTEQLSGLFGTTINPESGSISIHYGKSFDYEVDSHFYRLKIQLGSKTETVLIRLYDVQQGTSSEKLKIHDYSEFLSFTQGAIQPNEALFEAIQIDSDEPHNIADLRVSIEADIDAFESVDTAFERFDFIGRIHGNNHVIKNLNMPDGFFTSSRVSVVEHLGLVDFTSNTQSSIMRFDGSQRGARLSYVSFSGYVHNSLGRIREERLRYSLLEDVTGALAQDSVYSNIHHQADDGDFSGSASSGATVSSFLGITGSNIGRKLEHVYVNGSLHTESTKPVNMTAGCLSAGANSNFAARPGELFYCSQDYRVSNNFTHSNGNARFRDTTNVGMIQPISYFNFYYPSQERSSESQWRFVTNRNNNPVPRLVGNSYRDVDNDGVADDVDGDPYYDRVVCTHNEGGCYSSEAHGRSEEEFKQSEGWSGQWVSSKRWNIVDGEWPVLTDMPYPHEEGQVWMYSSDPGVVYQRFTYNDYLTDTKPVIPGIVNDEPALLLAPDIGTLYQGQAVDIIIENIAGASYNCRVVPALPDGLSISTTANGCRITGIPKTSIEYSDFTVNVSNSGGSSSINVKLDILPDLPVLNTITPVKLVQNESLDVLLINTGGKIEQCSVTPDLPQGLLLSTLDDGSGCRVSGMPTEISSTGEFRVTAINRRGSGSVAFLLTVSESLQRPLLSGQDFVDIVQDQPVNIVIENAGGMIQECEITPSLPRGLSLEYDESQCRITGVTHSVFSGVQYTVTAGNAGGTDQFGFDLSVHVSSYDGVGPNPGAFDHLGMMLENQYDEVNAPLIGVSINNPGLALAMESVGFPNQIISLTLDDGTVITESAELEDYFNLIADNDNSNVYLAKAQAFDFESQSHFYQLEVQLGDKTETALVRLYDVQQGTNSEKLKIHDYSEFLSFTQGAIQPNEALFESIQIDSDQPHNIADLRVSIEADIDASESVDIAFERFDFIGRIHGNNHVIKNLNMPAGFFTSSRVSVVEHLGLVDFTSKTQSSIMRFEGSQRGAKLSYVSFSGYVHNSLGRSKTERLRYSLLDDVSGALTQDSVYSNIHHRADDGDFLGSASSGASVSSFLGNTGSNIGRKLEHVYVNGSLHTESTKPVNMMAGCLSANTISDFATGSEELFYCSQDYRVSDNFTHSNGSARFRDTTNVGMIQPTSYFNSYFPSQERSSESQWRFVTNRNNNPVPRLVGNSYRDVDNDGVADDVDGDPYYDRVVCTHNEGGCYSSEAHGRSEEEFKQSEGWSGLWVSSERWDIVDGEWPVLTDMPYPHEEGQVWMHSSDPGVVYQRETYDDYLTR